MGDEEEDLSLVGEITESLEEFERGLAAQRLQTLLTGEYDNNNAILTFHAGAGGTEAMDWVSMLVRMYTRWSERHGFKVQLLDFLDGDEAGLKSATMLIAGDNAYGYLKSESGVHRLVRVSPFDASGRRHTSFVSYTKDLRLPMMFYTAAVNGVFAFLIAGGLLFTTHGVTPEFLLNLLFYIIITPVISLTLTRIMYMSENKMVVADALARIDSVLEAAPMQAQAVPQHPQDASVALQNVHFSYDGKTEIIKGVSLEIQPGQTVAFVGPSGGGKSTLANLVCRFFDVQSGSVRVGGADVRDIPKEERMDTISFVFQNSRLLKGSILDNVRLGRPQATEAEVLAALKAAQCMDIIEKFPAGIHTVIGTKGVYLSGGEQQRIAIARAMLKNAPILILDEATAFADPDNEAKVQAAFAQLAKGKTVLMIAHRLSTVANADCIYVVQDGQIAESGTKDELCAQNGLFARMWQEYQASVQWKVAKEG